MSQLSAILPLLPDASVHRQEIAARLHRLDEQLEYSSAEAIALWHAARRTDLRALEFEPYSVAILSDTTQDFFLPFLYTAAFACGLDLRSFSPGAGRIVDVVLAADSPLYDAQPSAVFVSYNQEEKLGRILLSTLDRGSRLIAAREMLDEIRHVVEQLTSRLPSARVVLHTFYWFHPPVLGFIDSVRPEGPSDITDYLNQELRGIARAFRNVYLLDMQQLIGTFGFVHWRDNNRWLGEAVDTVRGSLVLAREYLRFIKSFTKRSRKVIVVDLDNTLWGGLAGEEGLSGVQIGGGYPGNAFRQFQQALKLYSQRGVLLAINSKNNPDDAITILEQHPEMVLRPSDFAAMEINWRDKAANMTEISRQLDLAPSSFVFVDDSPQERELIRQALPEVLVPEFPAQVADLPALLSRLNDLDHDSYTETDRQRTELYRTEHLRRNLRRSAGNLDEYLSMLETTMLVASATEADLPRIEQMFQRTNQFNTTTKRYSLGELAAFANSPAHALVLGQVRDRFGDHGVVVVALLRFGEQAVIDSFLMSCRVIGRGVETAMLAHLAMLAARQGYGELIGEFEPTRKNEPSRDVYTRHGFVGIETAGPAQTFVLRELARSGLQPPNHIRLKESVNE